MIDIRPANQDEYKAVAEITRQAFGREHEARMVETLRRSPDFLPELSLVASVDDEVIGHILFSIITIHSERGALTALGLGPLSVRPDRQNQGIGSALAHGGLARCRAAGKVVAVQAVVLVGHPTYYPRFGFAPARPQGLEAPFPVIDEAWMALELRPGALAGISGRVTFPAAFNGV